MPIIWRSTVSPWTYSRFIFNEVNQILIDLLWMLIFGRSYLLLSVWGTRLCCLGRVHIIHSACICIYNMVVLRSDNKATKLVLISFDAFAGFLVVLLSFGRLVKGRERRPIVYLCTGCRILDYLNRAFLLSLRLRVEKLARIFDKLLRLNCGSVCWRFRYAYLWCDSLCLLTYFVLSILHHFMFRNKRSQVQLSVGI